MSDEGMGKWYFEYMGPLYTVKKAGPFDSKEEATQRMNNMVDCNVPCSLPTKEGRH